MVLRLDNGASLCCWVGQLLWRYVVQPLQGCRDSLLKGFCWAMSQLGCLELGVLESSKA